MRLRGAARRSELLRIARNFGERNRAGLKGVACVGRTLHRALARLVADGNGASKSAAPADSVRAAALPGS